MAVTGRNLPISEGCRGIYPSTPRCNGWHGELSTGIYMYVYYTWREIICVWREFFCVYICEYMFMCSYLCKYAFICIWTMPLWGVGEVYNCMYIWREIICPYV